MLHRILAGTAVLLVFIGLSCQPTFEHEYASETYLFDSIHKFRLFDNIDLEFIPSTENRIEIIAPESLIEKVTVDTSALAVEFHNYNKHNWLYYQDSIKAYVYYKPPLTEVRTHGTGTINLPYVSQHKPLTILAFEGAGTVVGEVNLNDLHVVMYSSTITDVFLTGQSTNLNVIVNGKGRTNLAGLQSEKVKYVHNSYNDQYVQASSALNVAFQNIGRLYYSGNPVITYAKESDSAKLSRLTD